MLEGLNQIDWGRLHHFKGKADDIPRIIRNLASHNEQVRAKAHYELEICLVQRVFKKKTFLGPSHPILQGYILSEAAEYVLPFLIELLESQQVSDNDHTFSLINLILDAVDVEQIDKLYELYIAHGTDKPKKDAQTFNEWSYRIYNQIRDNLHIYAAFLEHKDIDVFFTASALIKRFKGADDDFGKTLLARFHSTSDYVRKVNLLWLMGRLNSDKYSYILHEIYNNTNDPLVKFTAAINIGLIKDNLTEDQIDYLIMSIENNIEKLHALYLDSSLTYSKEWCWIWVAVGNYWKIMEEIFLASSDSIKSKAVSAMLKSLPNRLFWTDDNQHNTLLSVVLSDWTDPEGCDLDRKRKQAVLAVAQDVFYPEVMRPDEDIFIKYGLPGNYRAIAKYLGISKRDLDNILKPPQPPEPWEEIGGRKPYSKRSLSIEGLDKIDWESLNSFDGNVERVPEAIRNLASTNERIREDVWDILHYELVETFYYKDLAESGYCISEAAVYAFPFLIKLLESPKVQNKDEILLLIQLMYEATKVTNLDILNIQYANHIAKYPSKDALAIREWLQRFNREIRKYLPLFASLLDDEDYGAFSNAITLLFEFQDSDEEIGLKVMASFHAATDAKRQVKLLWLLGQMDRKEYYDLFEEIYNSTDDPLVAFTAALNAGMANENPTENQLERLKQSFSLDIFNPNKDYGYVELSSKDEKLNAILTNIFPTLSDAVKSNLFSMLLKQFDGSWPMTKGQHKTLLCIAFSDWKNPDAYNAVKIQKRAVRAVAQDVFRPKSRNDNTDRAMVLEEFGLPKTIDGIAKYLGVYPIDIINYK